MVFNREVWLNKAVEMMAPEFRAIGLMIPIQTYISVGLIRQRASAQTAGSVGITWHHASDKKGIYHVFISPVITDTVEVLSVLRHELIHCSLPPDAGHRKPFSQAAKALGLVSPWTSTPPSEELTQKFQERFIPALGSYEQPVFDNTVGERPGSRLLKASCSCGYTIRLTKKWAEQGLPLCPCCDNLPLRLEAKL